MQVISTGTHKENNNVYYDNRTGQSTLKLGDQAFVRLVVLQKMDKS